MDKDELVALGLTEEQADSVIESHKKDLAGKYIPKERFDTVNTQLNTTKEELTKRDTQLTSLADVAKDNEALTAAIDKLKADNRESEQQYQTQLTDVQKRGAVAITLGDTVQDASIVMNLLKLDDIQVSPSGEVAGLTEQIEKLKKEKPFLFVAEEDGDEDSRPGFRVRGTPPPASAGGGHPPTKATPEDIGKQFAARKKASIASMQTATEYYFNKK